MIRAAAWIGWLSFATGRLLAGIVWFAPPRIPWPLAAAGLLAVVALTGTLDGRADLAARPRPLPVALSEVVDARATGWVATSSVVLGPFAETFTNPTIPRSYYVLLDPRDDTVAMIARSADRLEARRDRTIVVRPVSDPTAAGRLTSAHPGAEPGLAFVELADRRPADVLATDVWEPGDGRPDATEVVLRGTFEKARPSADGDGWDYLVTRGSRGVVVRSSHPPDRLPVDVWGVPATDRIRASEIAALPAIRAAVDGRRLPERTLLAEGAAPPIPEVSFAMPIGAAILGTVLLLGWLAGYPAYRRGDVPDRLVTWPLGPAEEIAVEVSGLDTRRADRVRVTGAPGRIELLGPAELERREWQLGVAGRGGAAPAPRGSAAGGPAIPVLTSGEGPILVRLDRLSGLRIGAGRVSAGGAPHAALRITADDLDLVLAFDDDTARERALATIDARRLAATAPGAPPSPVRHATAAAPGDGTPIPVRAAAVAIDGVGLAVIAGGIFAFVGIGGSGDPGPGIAQVGIGAALLTVARGVAGRRGWAREVGFTVGWVGAAIAVFLVVAAPQCGLWLAPNLAACRAAGPLGAALALAAAVGLGYAALAIRRHPAAFDR